MTRRLAAAVWPDVERTALVAVPVGSTEQHGPHLPFSTDTEIAAALAERLAAAVPGVVVAPALAYGSSGEHQDFLGTLSIGAEALELTLVELGRSASETFAGIVLVSAHGGNGEPIARAARRLRAEGRAAMAWSPRWSGDAHAGRTETALMLALRPEVVQLSAAAAGNTAPLQELLPALRSHGIRSLSANGVLGDPSGASAQEGERLLAQAARGLVAEVRAWSRADGGAPEAVRRGAEARA